MLDRELIILNYHYIDTPSKDDRIKGLYVTPKQFDWQMRTLKAKGVQFLTFSDIFYERYDLDDKMTLAMLTFDDGAKNVYTNAFPILKKYNIKAIIYPVVGDIGKKGVVWEENANKRPLDLMTIDNMKEMLDWKIEFGSHLYNHVHADRLTVEKLKFELIESKKRLECILEKEVLSIAYPYGDYNEDVINNARKAGYKYGVTTTSYTNKNRNLFELCRIPIKGSRWHNYLYFKKIIRIIERLKDFPSCYHFISTKK